MKTDWGTQYVAVIFSEMESFLNDLAGASLSEENEKRRVTLEQKILTVKKISLSPSPSLVLQDSVNENQTEQYEQVISSALQPRTWSCPSLNECMIMEENKETVNLDGREMEMKIKQDEISCVESEYDISKPKDEKLTESLYSKKKFERLRQAYLDTIKVPRRRSASEPQVRTSSNHRRPNPEYIQGINTETAFTFEAKKDNEIRKPNKKGFNVVWGVSTKVCR